MPTSGRRLDQLVAYTPRRWTPEEDEVLRQGVRVHGAKRWKTIAGLIKSKTPPECCQRWRALQSLGSSVKRAWLPSEDRRIVELVAQYGARQWAVIASHIDGRTGKQCRERWHNQLDPRVSKAPWMPHEVELIRRRHALFGNRWAKITEALPGRTDNAVKNYWYSSMSAAAKTTTSRTKSRTSSRKTTSVATASQSPSCPQSKSSRRLMRTSARALAQSHTSALRSATTTHTSTDERVHPDKPKLLDAHSGVTGWPSAGPRLAGTAAAAPSAPAPVDSAATAAVAIAAEQQHYRAWLASLSLESWDAVAVSALPPTAPAITTTPEPAPLAVASPVSLDSLEAFELLSHDVFALPPAACWFSDAYAAVASVAAEEEDESELFVYESWDSSDVAMATALTTMTTTILCEPLALGDLELECMAPSQLDEFLRDVLRESSSSSDASSDALMWELAV